MGRATTQIGFDDDKAVRDVHALSDVSVKYRCLHCTYRFDRPDQLQDHYRIAHSTTVKLEDGSQRRAKRKAEWLTENDKEEINGNDGTSASSSTSNLDNDQDQEYFYFCNDCEMQPERGLKCTGESCNHFHHARVPIGIDIAGHMEKTGHTSLQPIQSFVSLTSAAPIDDDGATSSAALMVANISYSTVLGHPVRRKWKRLAIGGLVKTVEYSKPRSCMVCDKKFNDAFYMLIHIKEHVEQKQKAARECQ